MGNTAKRANYYIKTSFEPTPAEKLSFDAI